MANVLECVICRDDFADAARPPVAISCGHVFHKDCLDRWFSTKSSCPTCRTPCHGAERCGTRLFLNMATSAMTFAAGAGANEEEQPGAVHRSDVEASILMRQLDCAQKKLEEMRSETEVAQEERFNLQDQLDELGRDYRGAMREANELRNSLKYSREDVKRLTNERKELTKQLKAAETQVANNRVMNDTSLDEAALSRLIRGKDVLRVIDNQVKTIAVRNKRYSDLINELEETKREFMDERRLLEQKMLLEREKNEKRIVALTSECNQLRRATGAEAGAVQLHSSPELVSAPAREVVSLSAGNKENVPAPTKRLRQDWTVAASEMPAPDELLGVRVRTADILTQRNSTTGASLQNGFKRNPVRSVGRDNIVLEGPDGRGGLKKVVLKKDGALRNSFAKRGKPNPSHPSSFFGDRPKERRAGGGSNGADATGRGHAAAGKRNDGSKSGDNNGLTIKHFYS